MSDLKYLFEPRGVAIIGASHNPEKIGYQVVDNIKNGGYRGGIYPVNPRGGRVAGIDACGSIFEVVGDVDIAVIAVPAVHVFDTVKGCARKNVKHLVIITSGFSEIGNTSEEKRIVAFARDHGMRVLGPNIFGIYSAKARLNATFGPQDIRPGGVSIVTQSGAIGISMIGKSKIENIGLASIVSVGNKSDIDEADLLEYIMDQDDSKMVLMYIEGIVRGEHLVEALVKATKKKPVVVIKSGRSKRGAMAAASHTGSLAGTDEVFDDIVKQCGVIRAEKIDEALDLCRFLADAPKPTGNSSVIITNGGGVGVMAADASEKYGVGLYDNQVALRDAFGGEVPDFGSTKNPVDLTGAATAKDYDGALGVALKDKRIGSVICLGCETSMFDAEKFAGVVTKKYDAYKKKKPIVFSVFGGEAVEKGISRLRREGIPIFGDVYDAVSCMGALYSYHRDREHNSGVIPEVNFDERAVKGIVGAAKAKGRHFLFAHEAQEIMGAVGITVPRSRVARDIDTAVKCAQDIGYPVAMKVVSKEIIHKSDVGGVLLDLDNDDEVLAAYESIMHSCREAVPNAHIEGVEVAEMVQSGVETIVGARRDRAFGPIVMFGLGGIYVEVMKDVSFRVYPLSTVEAMSMISETKTYPLLLGVRGDERKDIDSVVSAIMKLGAVIKGCPDISDIEINPLMVYDQGQGIKAVDVRILLGGDNS